MNKINALCYLLDEIYPLQIIVDDERPSDQRNIPEKTNAVYPSYVKLTLVSGEFRDMSQHARHNLINKVLEPAIEEGLHVLSVNAFTPEEFELLKQPELELTS